MPWPTLGRILLVEDDPSDVELTLTALEDYKLANEVVVARDGQQALDYLRCQGEYKSRPKRESRSPASRPEASESRRARGSQGDQE